MSHRTEDFSAQVTGSLTECFRAARQSCRLGMVVRSAAAEPHVPHAAATAPDAPVRACRHEGTSPRVRGADVTETVSDPGRGNIPAGAGSSWPSSARWPGSWEHPRGCGEQPMSWDIQNESAGTSPRVRGAVAPGDLAEVGVGNIPAGAGSSTRAPGRDPAGWERPRGCGEQFQTGIRHVVGDGNIPAGAGSRTGPCPSGPSAREHPRGCGEQASAQAAQAESLGTSPRVRGADPRGHHGRQRRGNIPAGAGSRRSCPSAST